LQAGDHAVEDVHIVPHAGLAHAAFALVDGEPATQLLGDHVVDLLVVRAHDGDSRVLLDALDHEVHRLARGQVGDHGVERRFHTGQDGRHAEDHHVDGGDDVAHGGAQFAADHDAEHLGAVDDTTTAHGQPDAGAQEEATEHGHQQLVMRHL